MPWRAYCSPPPMSGSAKASTPKFSAGLLPAITLSENLPLRLPNSSSWRFLSRRSVIFCLLALSSLVNALRPARLRNLPAFPFLISFCSAIDGGSRPRMEFASLFSGGRRRQRAFLSVSLPSLPIHDSKPCCCRNRVILIPMELADWIGLLVPAGVVWRRGIRVIKSRCRIRGSVRFMASMSLPWRADDRVSGRSLNRRIGRLS